MQNRNRNLIVHRFGRFGPLACLLSVALLAGFGCASENGTAKKNQETQEKATAEANAKNKKLQARIDELESELEQARTLAKLRRRLNDDLNSELADLVDAGKLKVTTRRGLLIVEIPENVLFESGKFELSEEGKETLRSVASPLGELEEHQIMVAGHTDNVPVTKKSVDVENNWELSWKRAIKSAEVLAAAGVSKEKLATVGFGSHNPIAPNDTEEGRQKNRRVELMLVPDLSDVVDGDNGSEKNSED